MVQNLVWAIGYNVTAIPMAADITFGTGFVMKPAIETIFMLLSTIIVAIAAQLLRLRPASRETWPVAHRGTGQTRLTRP